MEALKTRVDYCELLDPIVEDVVAPLAAEIDQNACFPRSAIEALGRAGLLGLVSAPETGGLGLGLNAAADVVERLARHCASTAMIVCMHYAATAVLEAHADRTVREAVAAGAKLATLAFSEQGSRSNFWAPVSGATPDGDSVRLDAQKSWVTSAGEADLYVWSSLPARVDGPSTVWLVPADAVGLRVGAPFDGLGLRGNCSSPVVAEGVRVPRSAMLGGDGAGLEVMMSIVLPSFQILSAAVSVGTMEAATSKSAAHVAGTRLDHLGQSLADLPTIRAYIARMRTKTDMARALLLDTLAALEAGRDDAMLRVLEVKAGAGEASTEVTELAMRVCGGSAFRREIGVERHFRDARAATVMAPTTDVLYDFIGRAVCGLPLL